MSHSRQTTNKHEMELRYGHRGQASVTSLLRGLTLTEAYKSYTASANRAILIEHGARSMVTLRAARSSGSGLAVMQPINLGSGEDPILDLDRCDALSRLGQIVQRDHCIAQRWTINQYVAVYERRWLACVGIDFIFVSHLLADRLRHHTKR